jgi:hypothetical protein
MGVAGFTGQNPNFNGLAYASLFGANSHKGYGTGGVFVTSNLNSATSVAGNNGQGYGAGGGGAVSQLSASGATGGSGTAGMILVEY